jgi:DtxR family Mn-dependent transcriptional regulator
MVKPASIRANTGLTQPQEDYLKALYQLRGSRHSVSTSELASRMGVSPASVTEMLGKLAGLGLVLHDRYRGCDLTPAGQAVALEMVRHHRLLEMYLAEALGYGWDEVHDEAERLEHVISERMEERIYNVLGRPGLDPHGDPIPSRGGEISSVIDRPLTECAAGGRSTVRRVSDRDAGKLRALEEMGLTLGARVEVLDESRYEGPIAVRIGRRRVSVPLGLARAVFVADEGQPQPRRRSREA